MSTLKVNNLQVGQDSTATNNLTWFQPGSPDGTIRLGSGNAGSATTKFTFDKDGNLTCVGDITANSIIAPIEGTLDDWIIHAGDTNTKFGFPANDIFTVETAGSERLRIHADGEVDVKGGAAGQNALLVTGLYDGGNPNVDIQTWQRIGGAVAAKMIYKDATTDLHFGSSTSHRFSLMTGGTARLVLNSDGHVDVVGNLDVGAGVDVTGAVTADDLIVTGTSVVADLKSTNNNNVLGIAGNNATVKTYLGTDSSGNFLLATGSGVVERLRIELDGDFRFPTNIDTYIEEYKMIYDDDQTYREKFEKYVKQVVKMKKRMIDHKDLSKIHGFRGDVKKPWLNTYYSVVTESNFFRSRPTTSLFLFRSSVISSRRFL